METRGAGGWKVGDEFASFCYGGGSVWQYDGPSDALVGADGWSGY